MRFTLFCRTKLKNFDSDVVPCRAYVEINPRIKFGTAEARRMNWAIQSQLTLTYLVLYDT